MIGATWIYLLTCLGAVAARGGGGAPEDQRLSCRIGCATLREGIRRARIAIGLPAGPLRYDRAMLELGKGVVQLVTTDGIRLAAVRLPVTEMNDGTAPPMSIVLPASGLALIGEALGDATGTCTLAVGKAELTLMIDDAVVRFPADKSRFPNWQNVIPSDRKSKSVSLTKEALEKALAYAIDHGNGNDRKIDLHFEQGRLRVTSGDGPSAPVELFAAFGGEDVSIRVDWGYLYDFLEVLDEDPALVQLWVESSRSAVLLTTGEDFRYVVMPIAVPS